MERVYVYVFVETSVHNPEDDGSVSEGYDPMNRIDVYADKDTAILAAEKWLSDELTGTDEELDELDDDDPREDARGVIRTARLGERHVWSVVIRSRFSITRADVWRAPVLEHVPSAAAR